MYLRILAGGHAGTVRNVAPAVARVLLSDGRAELEYPVSPVSEVTAVELDRTDPAPTASSKPARGRAK